MASASKISAGLRLVVPFLDYPSQDWYYGDHGTVSASADSTAKRFRLNSPGDTALVVEPMRSSPQI
jgi:hypothetical protein